MQQTLSYLDAAEVVLERNARPMTSKEIVAQAVEGRLIVPKGTTPHKTMNARISEDMIQNPASRFMRTDHGQFALRVWLGSIAEFKTKPRKINPIDEDILVIDAAVFAGMIAKTEEIYPNFFSINTAKLLEATTSRKRIDVEENNDYVQIVSLFHIILNGDLLTYRRTSRLPEKRLHHARSINFGGHMISADRAPMFEQFLTDEMPVVFSRELYEELEFSTPLKSVRYEGALHSNADAFSRRHVGVCFQVVPTSADISSAEPGFHTDVQFMSIADIYQRGAEFDDWTRLVIERMAYADGGLLPQ